MKILHIFFNKRKKEKRDIIEQTILEKYNQYYNIAKDRIGKEIQAIDNTQ